MKILREMKWFICQNENRNRTRKKKRHKTPMKCQSLGEFLLKFWIGGAGLLSKHVCTWGILAKILRHKTNTVLGGSRGRKEKGEMLGLYYNLKNKKK